MIFLGNSVMSNMSKEAISQESLGLPFWRTVIAAGIISLAVGPVNILAVSIFFCCFHYFTHTPQSYIFQDTTTHLSARQVRSHGAAAGHKADIEAIAIPNPSRGSRYRSFFLNQKRNLPSFSHSL